MHSKLALFEGMSPEQKGALIGSLLGAGVGGLGGAFGSKKDKLRNSILAALAGGAGGAGLGYLGGRYFAPNPIADATRKIAPEAAKAVNDPAGTAFTNILGAASEGIKSLAPNSPKGGIAASELGEEAKSGPGAGTDTKVNYSSDLDTLNTARRVGALLAPPGVAGFGAIPGLIDTAEKTP